MNLLGRTRFLRPLPWYRRPRRIRYSSEPSWLTRSYLLSVSIQSQILGICWQESFALTLLVSEPLFVEQNRGRVPLAQQQRHLDVQPVVAEGLSPTFQRPPDAAHLTVLKCTISSSAAAV